MSTAVGSKVQVWNNTAKRTSGGLTKGDLMKNKAGKVVSKKQHLAGVRTGKKNLGEHLIGGSLLGSIIPFGSLLGLGLPKTRKSKSKSKSKSKRGGGAYASEGGAYTSLGGRVRRGGNIFDDITHGIGSVLDVGSKILPFL